MPLYAAVRLPVWLSGPNKACEIRGRGKLRLEAGMNVLENRVCDGDDTAEKWWEKMGMY